MASEAEKEIREAAVQRLRELRPEARIIHELKVFHGQNRVDLAVVSPDEIILVEIKSQKDNLARLQDQANACHALSNHSLIVLHEKHVERGHVSRRSLMDRSCDLSKGVSCLKNTTTGARYGAKPVGHE